VTEVLASARRVFITGADGFLGRSLLAELVREGGFECIVAADVRAVPMQRRRPGVVYMELDVRDPALGEQLAKYRVDTVVHLASIVTPGRNSSRDLSTRWMCWAAATCCRPAWPRACSTSS